MKKIYLIFIFALMIPFAFAVNPHDQSVQMSTGTTLTIEHPTHLVFPINTDFDLHFHLYNSTGYLKRLDPGDFCTIHIYNRTGGHALLTNLTTDSNGVDYVTPVLNYDMKGANSYIVWCERADGENGWLAGEFFITEDGEIHEGNPVYIAIAIMVIGSIGLLYAFAGSLSGEQTWVQPLKFFIYMIGMFIILLLEGFMIQVLKYTTLTNGPLANIFYFIYFVTMFLVIPLFIFFMVRFIQELLTFWASMDKSEGGGWK